MCGLPPQEDAIFVGTQWSHVLESMGSLDFALRVTVITTLGLIRSLATKPPGKSVFPRYRPPTPLLYILSVFFRTMSANVSKQKFNEGI